MKDTVGFETTAIIDIDEQIRKREEALKEEDNPVNNHIVELTSPIDALSLAPSLPTIDASIYSMMIVEICANIVGRLNCIISLFFWAKERFFPSITSINNDFFIILLIILYSTVHILSHFLNSE